MQITMLYLPMVRQNNFIRSLTANLVRKCTAKDWQAAADYFGTPATWANLVSSTLKRGAMALGTCLWLLVQYSVRRKIKNRHLTGFGWWMRSMAVPSRWSYQAPREAYVQGVLDHQTLNVKRYVADRSALLWWRLTSLKPWAQITGCEAW